MVTFLYDSIKFGTQVPPSVCYFAPLVRPSNTVSDTVGYNSNLSTSAPLHTSGYQLGIQDVREMQGTVEPRELIYGWL